MSVNQSEWDLEINSLGSAMLWDRRSDNFAKIAILETSKIGLGGILDLYTKKAP